MELHNVSTLELMTILEDIFVTSRIIAFERYNFIHRKQKKTESLEKFHSNLVELASRADCGDREDEWVRDMFAAHMNNDSIAEELLAQTRSPQDAYEYAIRREKGIEHSRTMQTNPFGGHQITPKQEPVNYINTRVALTILTSEIHNEGEAPEGDRFNAGHKITEDNKELPTPAVKNSAINVEISITKFI